MYHKQFVTSGQRNQVIENINKKIKDAIFVGGIAYQTHCVNALEEGGYSEKEALQKLRYPKDIDFFTEKFQLHGNKLNDAIINALGKSYERRFDEYSSHKTQRKKKVGSIKLKEKIDECNERDVYIGVDIFRPSFFVENFPEGKGEGAVESLKKNYVYSNLHGNKLRVQGLDDLVAMKLVGVKRANGGTAIFENDAADVLNLIYLHTSIVDFNSVASLIGRKTLIEQLDTIREHIEQKEDFTDNTLSKIMEEQVVPQPLEVSMNLLVDDRKLELEELEKVIRTIK